MTKFKIEFSNLDYMYKYDYTYMDTFSIYNYIIQNFHLKKYIRIGMKYGIKYIDTDIYQNDKRHIKL